MRISTIGRLVLLFLIVIFTLAVALMSFWWSLGRTILFTTSVVQDEMFGVILGLVIQLGPQVFLALASISSGNDRVGWWVLFWVFSSVDALTNIGARYIIVDESGITHTFTWWAVGIFIDIIIVFGEEMIGYSLSVMFHVIGSLVQDFGGEPPEWLFMGSDATYSLGTGRRPPSQRAPQPPQQGGRGGGKRGRSRGKPQSQPQRGQRQEQSPPSRGMLPFPFQDED